MAIEIAGACQVRGAVRAAPASLVPAARRRSVRASALLLAALALTAPASAAPQRERNRDICGLWVDHREGDHRKVAVWIEDCDGSLCGRIYWLRKPLTGGQPKRDQHNPDAALRDRPLCGLMILSGFRQGEEGARSAGRIYNPDDGRTFRSTMYLEPDGTLRIRGYVGFALFGKTVFWVRPQEAPARSG